MSLALPELNLDAVGFPRVSGDEPSTKGYAPALILFSPRERG